MAMREYVELKRRGGVSLLWAVLKSLPKHYRILRKCNDISTSTRLAIMIGLVSVVKYRDMVCDKERMGR